MIYHAADEVIRELFDSHKNRYQNNLESMKVVSLPLILPIYCIINVITKIQIMMDHI